ncbi:MAG: c-type cytochrome domain-containing protein [bacterium]
MLNKLPRFAFQLLPFVVSAGLCAGRLRAESAMEAMPAIAHAAQQQAAEKMDPAGVEFFEKNVRPILTDRCYKCHSAQEATSKGGLIMDTRAGLLAGGDSDYTLAPDGTYVSDGHPTLAPNGSYVGYGRATLAPDGTYVGGDRATLAPNGSYVGGDRATLAPDGSYVGGDKAVLTPAGTYVGVYDEDSK